MALIDWKLLMNFDQFARFIVDFLPESHRLIADIHRFPISRSPTMASSDVQPINAALVGQCDPLTELPLVLFSTGH
jgi:hypothetical protein